MAMDYYGKCGSCRYCDLSTANRGWGKTTFKCTKSTFGSAVTADEKACSKFEPAHGRSNDTIEAYTK